MEFKSPRLARMSREQLTEFPEATLLLQEGTTRSYLQTPLVTFWADSPSAISAQTVTCSTTWPTPIARFDKPKRNLYTCRPKDVQFGAVGCTETRTLTARGSDHDMQRVVIRLRLIGILHTNRPSVSTSLNSRRWLEPITGCLFRANLAASYVGHCGG